MLSPLKKVELDAVPVADSMAMSTAPAAIVRAVLPVTSPVCVALVTLAVLAATADSKSAILGIATVPVNVGLAIGALSPNAVVIVLA